MTSPQLLIRVGIYGVLLGIVDAVSGRTLQASPDPSTLLALLATAWVAHDLGEEGEVGLAVPAALTLWAAYFAVFIATAHVLVGWNNSVPWRPRSVRWVIGFAGTAVLAAAVGLFFGTRARARRQARGQLPD